MTDGQRGLAHIRKNQFDKLEVVDGFAEHLSIGVGGEELVDGVDDGPGHKLLIKKIIP